MKYECSSTSTALPSVPASKEDAGLLLFQFCCLEEGVGWGVGSDVKHCSENQPFTCHLESLRIHQSVTALGRNLTKVPAVVRKYVLHQMLELSGLI